MGLSAAVARRDCRAGPAVYTDRPEPDGPIGGGQSAARQSGRNATAPSPGRRLFVGRAGGGDCLALHRALYGRLAGLRDSPAGRAGAGHFCGSRSGSGPALPGRQLGARRGQTAAQTRRLDGHAAPLHGLSDVGHGGLAAVGAGPFERSGRRRQPAGPAPVPESAGLVPEPARAQPQHPSHAVPGRLPVAGARLGSEYFQTRRRASSTRQCDWRR